MRFPAAVSSRCSKRRSSASSLRFSQRFSSSARTARDTFVLCRLELAPISVAVMRP